MHGKLGPQTTRGTLMGTIDAVTAEVVRNALSMAAQEGGVVVVKASHSTFIQEGADSSAAVLDARGRLHLLFHAGPLSAPAGHPVAALAQRITASFSRCPALKV